MTPSSFIPLSDLIQKAIQGKGSKNLLNDHLVLWKDLAIYYEKRVLELEAKLAECESLLAEVSFGSVETMADLKKQDIPRTFDVPRAGKQERAFHAAPLEEIEKRLLLCVSSGSKNLTEIADETRTGKEVVAFHTEQLAKKKLLCTEHVPTVGDLWSLTREGRKYLIHHKLIE